VALPDFLCIGAQKAGTSWLFEQLRTHPNVWMPPVKELHYFDYLHSEDTRKWAMHHLRSGVASAIKWHMNHTETPNIAYVHYLSGLMVREPFTEGWYRSAFDWAAAKGKLLGDITPEYSAIGPEGIAYLKSLIPHVKLIYILRHPYDRALSQLKMNVSRRPIDVTSTQAWQAAADAPEIRMRGAYSSYIPQWEAAFPASQLMFIPYRRLRNEPEPLLADVQAFLGLPDFQFANPRSSVHVTADIQVPSHIQAGLKAAMQGEAEYIRQRFGEEFASQT